MAEINFKGNKKRLFLMIFGVVFFALNFWLVQPAQKAEAACGGECYSDAGTCKTDETGTIVTGTPYKLCTINTPSGYSGAIWGTTSCSSGSGAIQVQCRQDGCPSTANPALNGKPCDILVGTSSWGVCNNPIVDTINGGANGFWDESENQCIQCSGLKEGGVCGDITQIYSNTGGFCNGSGPNYNKFETACNSGISIQCDEQSQGCVGTAGFCNSSGVYTACPLNNCSGGACPGATLLNVTANPNTVTKDSPTNVEFTVTSGGAPFYNAGVSVSGAGATGNCSTNSGGKCTISVKATSVAVINVLADKVGYTPGSTIITVNPAAACVFGGATFMVGFKSSTYNVGDTPKVNFTVPAGHDACTELYKPNGTSSGWNRNDGPGSYFNTTTTLAGVVGTWKVTISDGAGSCSAGSTCSATATVNSAVPPPPPPPATCSTDADCTNPKFAQCISGSCYECSNNTNCAHFPALPTCDLSLSPHECVVTVSPPPGPVCGDNTDGICPTGCTNPPDTNCPVIPSTPPGPCDSGATNYRSPLSYCSIQDLIQGATGWVLGLVSSIVILFLVYGGIMYAMAAGDEAQMESAKNIIYYAILGLAIILVSYTLITEVKTILKVK